MRVARLFPLLLLFAAACESDPLATAARNVEVTGSPGAADTHTLDFAVHNRGGRTVYAAACDHRIMPTVQRRDRWDEDTEFGVFCLAIVSSRPVAVEPGATVHGQAQVSGPGEYRVAVVIHHEENADEQRVVFSRGVIVP
jgi:hypothetical protein